MGPEAHLRYGQMHPFDRITVRRAVPATPPLVSSPRGETSEIRKTGYGALSDSSLSGALLLVLSSPP